MGAAPARTYWPVTIETDEKVIEGFVAATVDRDVLYRRLAELYRRAGFSPVVLVMEPDEPGAWLNAARVCRAYPGPWFVLLAIGATPVPKPS